MAHIHYFWNPVTDNVIEEYDDAGATIAAYSSEPTLHGTVLSQNRADSGERHFYGNGRGDATEVTDSTDALTDTRRYTGFGRTIESSGVTLFPFQYNGQQGYYTDFALEQMYVRARTFDLDNGRWLSQDPIGVVDGPNLYTYVGNSPINNSDPSGQLKLTPTCLQAQINACKAHILQPLITSTCFAECTACAAIVNRPFAFQDCMPFCIFKRTLTGGGFLVVRLCLIAKGKRSHPGEQRRGFFPCAMSGDGLR